MKSVCSKCKEEKVKIRGKRKSGGMAYLYSDELGRKWNSNTCPPCYHKDLNNRQKRRRLAEKLATLEGR